MKPSDMSPVSSHERGTGYNQRWDNISPVNKPPDSDEFTKFPSTEFSTPSAATKYAETRENRIDSFTKAFTDTISKAMMSELNMSLESATKTDSNPEVHSSPLKPAEPTPSTFSKSESLLSPKHKAKDASEVKKPELAVRPRSPEPSRRPEAKTGEAGRKPDMKTPDKRGEGKQPDPRKVEHTPGNKGRKSISGTESNSSVASLKLLPQR